MNDLPSGIKLPIDVDKFQKILQNLLSNAVKYTEPGGHVIVRVTLTDDMKLRVSVIDDGIGMKPEEAKSIFELYRRLRPVEAGYKGSGIGLYYTKQLVLVHKGYINDAMRELEIACSMDPGNMEYQNAKQLFNDRAGGFGSTYYDRGNTYRQRQTRDDECCDACCRLWMLDTCCECMGGDCVPCV